MRRAGGTTVVGWGGGVPGKGGVWGLTQPPWSWIQPSSRSRRKSIVQPMMVLMSSGTLVHRAWGSGWPQEQARPQRLREWPGALPSPASSCSPAASFPLAQREPHTLAPGPATVSGPAHTSVAPVPVGQSGRHSSAHRPGEGSDGTAIPRTAPLLRLSALPHPHSHQRFLPEDPCTC